MHLVKDYILGDPAAQQKTYVKVFQSNTKPSGSTLAKRDSSPPTTPLNGGKHIDLTPAPCTSKACYPGEHQYLKLKVVPQPISLIFRVFHSY
jgi:hypothetical protein